MTENEPSTKTTCQRPQQQNQRIFHQSGQQNTALASLPSLSHPSEKQFISVNNVDDSTTDDQSVKHQVYNSTSMNPSYSSYHNRSLLQNTDYPSKSPKRTQYSVTPSSYRINREKSTEHDNTAPVRNYLEIFRNGEANPSECYSLPINKPVSKGYYHSFYDSHKKICPEKSNFDPFSSDSQDDELILSSSTCNSYHHPQTIQNSPDHDNTLYDNCLRQSKLFDYRPLRTKLQREYKITPSLLIDA